MLCSILVAIGLTTASCIVPNPAPVPAATEAPARDLAAEVLIEQEERDRAEDAKALAKRDKLYSWLKGCVDCSGRKE
jgi:hypothetical protein